MSSERKIVEYQILTGDGRKELSKKVIELMKEGRQPHGGIGVRNLIDGMSTEVLQAMVKYE